MIIGTTKELKNHEYRVGLTPDNILSFVAHGHTVYVETRAGEGAGFTDDAYRAAGAVVLDTAFAALTVKNQDLRIGGFHGYYRYWGMLETTGVEEAFADAFENTDRFKLLLDHIPTGWVDWGKIDELPVDLVLSGHYHGGQIRIPLLGGLYAPYIGLFPQYTEGMYVGETATAILSTGLGSSPGIPRINNLPQIVVVDLAQSQEVK